MANTLPEGHGGADLDAPLFGTVFDGPDELGSYLAELNDSGIRTELARAEAEFGERVTGATSRGFPYGFGGMKWRECGRLYSLIRKLRPRSLVETGVCNGTSTAVILLALDRNGEGLLHSIDLPEYTETEYSQGDFWEGKLGSAVPRGRQPGWVVPDDLRGRWQLTIGRSQDVLGGLLERLGRIDFFLHDSEHSYECMMFEYRLAYEHLSLGGVLASDDIGWNTAFEDFAREHELTPYSLGKNLAFAHVGDSPDPASVP